MLLRTKLLAALAVCIATAALPGSPALLAEEPESAERALSAPARAVAERAIALGDADDLDALLEAIGDRPHVLLGEASHGTSEFYTWRAKISRRLIEEKGFRFIAVEGDWANCWEVNRYVKDLPGAAETAEEALEAFDRWPQWMWKNREVLELVEWMRAHNEGRPANERAGFYGIDLYTPWHSMRVAEEAAGELDEELAAALAERFDCLRVYREGTAYAQALAQGRASCATPLAEAQELVVAQEDTLREADEKAFLSVKQNIRVVRNAESHYRGMVDPSIDSWNERARHFFETYDRLIRFHCEGAQGIVWAHNTHIGDARETSMTVQGQVNIGQLARESYGRERVFALGFGTDRGTVIAGPRWEGPRQTMRVPPAPEGSLERMLNSLGDESFYFFTEEPLEPEQFWTSPVPHRAIGVVYNPMHDNPGNYVPTILPRRYDAFLFIPETNALSPL